MDAAKPLPPPALPSPLYKPLHELTEDDIAQVTREDCRRFLKEKGMRRPSWNKSQAIQQVISLKALLETKADDDDGDHTAPSPKRWATQPPPASSSPPVTPPLLPDLPTARLQTSRPSRSQVASAHPPPPPADVPRVLSPADVAVPSFPRAPPPSTVGPQMIIFYGGTVSVYDAMPPEKAVAIMKVATCRDTLPNSLPPFPVHTEKLELAARMAVQANRPIAPRPPPAPAVNCLPPSQPQPAPFLVGMARYPFLQQREGTEDRRSSRDTEPDGPAGRKASLQRYLDKKKDRKIFKSKRSFDGLSPSDLELFLSQKAKPHTDLGLQCNSEAISFSHPFQSNSTPTRSCFIESLGQTVRLSINLNDDVSDVQEV